MTRQLSHRETFYVLTSDELCRVTAGCDGSCESECCGVGPCTCIICCCGCGCPPRTYPPEGPYIQV